MKKNFDIPWHDTHIKLSIPASNVLHYPEAMRRKSTTKNSDLLKQAITNADVEIDRLIRNRHVALVIEDETRDVPFADKFDALFPRLGTAAKITVIIATGTHNPQTSGNYKIRDLAVTKAKENQITLEKVVIHDGQKSDFYSAGITSYGNEIFANSLIRQAEIIILFSDMKYHYFAGYSNPVKNIIPGICKFETAEYNHAMALDKNSVFGSHPLHPDKKRRGNPLAGDMWEGFQLVVGKRPVYALITISVQGKFLWAGAGTMKKITPKAMLEVDRFMGVKMIPADKLIVSCGGYPNDESLYHAQKALELCKFAVRDGGEVLLLAGCANGIGPEKSVQNFYEPLKSEPQKIIRQLNKKYIMYAHKTYKFAEQILRLKAIHLYTLLKKEEVEDIHLRYCPDAQALVDNWLAENPQTQINVIFEGNKIAVLPQ